MAEAIITSVYTSRPPYWSVQIPRNIRLTEPVRTGVATRRPNWVSVRPRSCLILTPMIEKIVQTAKQKTNAIVLMPSIWCWSRWDTWAGEFIFFLRGCRVAG